MKTYVITFNARQASFSGEYTACNPVFACVKAVMQFYHLGGRFNTIVAITEKIS